MKTDRELLELAAKAAGLNWEWNACAGGIQHIPHGLRHYVDWNPLTDNGDAIKLAVVLELDLNTGQLGTIVYMKRGTKNIEELSDDYMAAFRRAVVRAAAAIGESMQ